MTASGPSGVASGPGGVDGIEIHTATRSSGDDWTEPTWLTNGSALNLGPSVVGYNRSGGTAWLVARMADTDANLSTTGDREVRYAILNGSLDIEVSGRLPDNTNVDLASSDSGFTFVSARGSGANASVVRARLTPRGSVLDRDVFRAASVTDVSTAADDTVWVSTNGTQSSVTYLNGTETERVPLGNASANATVRGVGAGRNWTRTVALNASDIDGPAVAIVTLDPDRSIDRTLPTGPPSSNPTWASTTRSLFAGPSRDRRSRCTSATAAPGTPPLVSPPRPPTGRRTRRFRFRRPAALAT